MQADSRRVPLFLLPAAAFFVCLFFATLRLSEAPQIWYDEGYYAQVAINVADTGTQFIQVAPKSTEPTWTVSAGYTLFYPVALAYKLFGVGVVQGRAVMVFYILAFLIAAYVLIRKLHGPLIAGY